MVRFFQALTKNWAVSSCDQLQVVVRVRPSLEDEATCLNCSGGAVRIGTDPPSEEPRGEKVALKEKGEGEEALKEKEERRK